MELCSSFSKIKHFRTEIRASLDRKNPPFRPKVVKSENTTATRFSAGIAHLMFVSHRHHQLLATLKSK